MIDQVTGEYVGPFVRTPYNYDMEAASLESGLACPEPTLAQQQFKEECDINTIVKNFGLTGQLPENVRMPVSGDFTDAVTDYQSALNMVIEADAAFMKLPADVRAEFQNDPQKLLLFLEDDKNRERAVKLGLLVPPSVPAEPIAVRVIPEPAAK